MDGQNIPQEELDAMSKAYSNPIPAPVDIVVDTADATSIPLKVVDVPIISADKPVDDANKGVVPPVVEKTKSFEDYLAERSAGKYNKWEDVESVINAPKDEFADDEVRHWNELKKGGVKINKEFFELQSLDLESLKNDPQAILLQTMKLKGENLSDRTLKVNIEKKYGVSTWVDKEDSELTDEEAAYKETFIRDANNDLEWLRNFKKERTFIPTLDPAAVQKQEAEKATWQKNWEKFVDDDLTAKATSLSVVINPDTKDSFEYKISEADRKEVGDIMKLLPKDVNALFSPYLETDAQGNPQINHSKVQRMLLRDKVFDQAVINARKDGEAFGAKKEFENIKNLNFKPVESNVSEGLPSSEEEAFAQAARKQGRVF